MSEDHKGKRRPGAVMSFLVLRAAVAVLLLGVMLFDCDMHIVLLCALAMMCITLVSLGYSFADLVGCMKRSLSQALAAVIIFIFIGIIISSLISSGTVPALIYYGLQYIIPDYFFPIGLLLCGLTSMPIGTSWGIVGVMGLAMMGVEAGMGVPVSLAAGMVISGVFFGDKMSFISGNTNLAPAAAGAILYAHIGAMQKTTSPSYIIALAVFTVLGLFYHGRSFSMDTVNLSLDTTGGQFHISPPMLMPMTVFPTLNLMKYLAVPSMAVGTVLAMLVAVFYQGCPIDEVVAGLDYGYAEPTGVELVDKLLLRGGIQSMMYIFSLSRIAVPFGGIMERVGYLPQIVKVTIKRVRSDRMMVPAIMAGTAFGTLTMGEVFFSTVVNDSLYKEVFKERGLRPEMLSRLLEEGGTLTQVFIPWSTSGVFILSTSGVGVSQYQEYTILNCINPVLSVALAIFGICVLKVGAEEKKSLYHRSIHNRKLS